MPSLYAQSLLKNTTEWALPTICAKDATGKVRKEERMCSPPRGTIPCPPPTSFCVPHALRHNIYGLQQIYVMLTKLFCVQLFTLYHISPVRIRKLSFAAGGASAINFHNERLTKVVLIMKTYGLHTAGLGAFACGACSNLALKNNGGFLMNSSIPANFLRMCSPRRHEFGMVLWVEQ